MSVIRSHVADEEGLPTGGGGLVGKVGGTRNAAMLAAAGTVVVVGLFSLRKKAGTSATAPQVATYDSSPSDLWNAWQKEFEALQGEINNLQRLPPPVGIDKPPVPTPAPTLVRPIGPIVSPDGWSRIPNSQLHPSPYRGGQPPMLPG